MLPKLGEAFSHPLRLSWCERTPTCMLILTAIYGFSLLIYHYTKPNYRRRVEHGSAEWGKAQKIAKKYSQSPREMNKILTQNVEIGYDAHKHRRNLNTLVVGGSGAGKTRFYAKPNIMQGNTSFVVLDPKGEILRDTGKLLEAKGYEVRVLDLINMEKSMCYNPLLYAESDNDVQRLVTNLFKATTPKGSQSQDPFWDTAASMLLMALIFYVKAKAYPNQQTFGKVLELLAAGEVNEEDSNQQSILDEMFGDLAEEYPGHIALKYYTAYRGGAAKTLKSIQITLQARLEKFNLESLNLLCSADELDLKTLGTKKVALFALIPDNDTSFNFLVSMLYTQLFQQLFYIADHVYGGNLPIPVHFLMDEFSNVSLPDDFDKILSVMRSRGVSVSIILQNLAQLKALFEKQWESIIGNCDEFVYLGGNEQSTHKYVSELLGKATIDTNTYGKSDGMRGNFSTNYQNTGRELMTPDEVRLLDNRYAILFIRGERPVLDFKYDILKHPNLALTADGDRANAYEHGVRKPEGVRVEVVDISAYPARRSRTFPKSMSISPTWKPLTMQPLRSIWNFCKTKGTKRMKNKKKMPLKARKFLKVWVTAVLVIFVVGAMALTCFAAEDDPITVVNNFSDFMFGLVRAVGMIMLGFAVVQIGLSLKSHDPSQRANGFLTLAGGVVITFAKEILNLITGG